MDIHCLKHQQRQKIYSEIYNAYKSIKHYNNSTKKEKYFQDLMYYHKEVEIIFL